MALAHHDAAHRHERKRADAISLRAQDRGDDDIAPGLEPAIRTQLDPMAQPIEGQHRLTSLRPISHGVPAYLMLVCGDAPVPPLWPETRMTSACAFATPAATVPIPAWLTSFTQTRARGLICFRS